MQFPFMTWEKTCFWGLRKSPWLRTDSAPTHPQALLHPGQLRAASEGPKYTPWGPSQPGSPYRDTGADTRLQPSPLITPPGGPQRQAHIGLQDSVPTHTPQTPQFRAVFPQAPRIRLCPSAPNLSPHLPLQGSPECLPPPTPPALAFLGSTPHSFLALPLLLTLQNSGSGLPL